MSDWIDQVDADRVARQVWRSGFVWGVTFGALAVTVLSLLIVGPAR